MFWTQPPFGIERVNILIVKYTHSQGNVTYGNRVLSLELNHKHFSRQKHFS